MAKIRVWLWDSDGDGFGDDPNAPTVEVDLTEYLKGVVPSEMPALWEEEALKAQALAAKAYAEYALQHPRHGSKGADVCNTVHCQVYNPDKRHERTDAAVDAIASRRVVWSGNPIEAVYHARCDHGRTLSAKEVWGEDVPYLQSETCHDQGSLFGHGVGLCQWGARAFAQAGIKAADIIKHFYRGVDVIGEEPPPPPPTWSDFFHALADFLDEWAAKLDSFILKAIAWLLRLIVG